MENVCVWFCLALCVHNRNSVTVCACDIEGGCVCM